MRTMAVRTVALALVLVCGRLALGQPAAGGAPKPGGANPSPREAAAPANAARPTIPNTLEEMLAQALKAHADIRVAEAKVREADALLEQARLQVAQKVITHYHALHAQKLAVTKAEETATQASGLDKAQAISAAQSQAAKQALIAEKVKLAELEAQTPLLLGDTTRPATAKRWRVIDPSMLDPMPSPNDAYFLVFDNKLGIASNQKWAEIGYSLTNPPRGTLAERIRKALDTSVRVDYKDKTIDEILKDVKEKMPGVAFLDNVPKEVRKTKETVQLAEQVPLGAALQALSDNLGLRFAARDYGVLVTMEKLPADAVPLHDFWKSDPGKEKPQPAADAKKNPPKEPVEGTIKAVDEKSGLVTITIGSDAGLEVGHTLEVFRLGPKPKYLGVLKLLQVMEGEAVGKTAASAGDKIEVGDRVASKLLRH